MRNPARTKEAMLAKRCLELAAQLIAHGEAPTSIEQARRIAANITKLPELLGQAK